jgi:urease accessory protein
MPWHARLQLKYTVENVRTVARFEHNGPLRILQSLYPEGDGICHNVLVHPPGGLVGGDTLDITATVGPGAHGLVTTPGATRFYRSAAERALQRTHLLLEEDSRLEWLPLEALCYNACNAENHLTLNIAPGAECIGWDVTALGLPHAGQPFATGRFVQHIEVHGQWLERGVIDAADHRLLQSPLGLAGQRCVASLFFVAGTPLDKARRDTALEAARIVMDTHALKTTAGATSPNGQVVVQRVLAPQVEPAMQLLKQVRAAWRAALWQLDAAPPRIWSV